MTGELAPYTYDQDDEKRRIRVTVHGAISVADGRAIVDRQVESGTWHYTLLCDVRAMPAGLGVSDIAALVRHVQERKATLGPRGAVALVARGASIVGLAQIFAFREGFANVNVFWDLDEAERWLDEKTTRNA
jgi:hypothetical protein